MWLPEDSLCVSYHVGMGEEADQRGCHHLWAISGLSTPCVLSPFGLHPCRLLVWKASKEDCTEPLFIYSHSPVGFFKKQDK